MIPRAEQATARHLWWAGEPYHAVVYFAPDARSAYEAVGLKGFWMGYFASRAAPMGPVPAEVVIATFYNFHPRLVTRAIPDAWARATPDDILAARFGLADRALRAVLGEATGSPDLEQVAALARRVVEECDPEGRPLYAAHSRLDWPDEPHLALWHAMTCIREHRGDGHISCLVAEGITGCEAHVLSVAAGSTTADLQKLARDWSEDEWAAAVATLADRGLVTVDGQMTAAGTALKQHVEDRTDSLAARPLRALTPDERERLIGHLLDAREAIVGMGGLPFPNPIGLPFEPPG